MFELITLQNAFVLCCVYILYGLGLGIYRLYFDPLSKFPGPKIAALTLWYEFYYDVIKRGRYTFEIEKMHKVYGQLLVLISTVSSLSFSEILQRYVP